MMSGIPAAMAQRHAGANGGRQERREHTSSSSRVQPSRSDHQRPAATQGSRPGVSSNGNHQRPTVSGNNGHGNQQRPAISGNNGHGNQQRPTISGNGHGNQQRPTISGNNGHGNQQRPVINGNGQNTPANRPAVGNGNNHNRPGNDNHRPGVGTAGNRPGVSTGGNRPAAPAVSPNRPGHGLPAVGPNRPGHGLPAVGPNRPGHNRPVIMQPPHRPYRPVMMRPHYRPVPPPAWRPAHRVPVIGGILGLTFGTAINASLDYLFNNGFTVDGYVNDVVYLRNVPVLNYVWTDGALYYGANGLDVSSFYYSTPSYDMSRYNNEYLGLVTSYGAPVSATRQGGVVTSTWFGGNNGYITLSFGASNGRYLTTLTMGM